MSSCLTLHWQCQPGQYDMKCNEEVSVLWIPEIRKYISSFPIVVYRSWNILKADQNYFHCSHKELFSFRIALTFLCIDGANTMVSKLNGDLSQIKTIIPNRPSHPTLCFNVFIYITKSLTVSPKNNLNEATTKKCI